MSRDQRSFPRTELDAVVSAKVGDKTIDCRIHNISVGGALLRVEAADTSVGAHIGHPATFTLSMRAGSSVSYNGQIVRLFESGDIEYIAVRFL